LFVGSTHTVYIPHRPVETLVSSRAPRLFPQPVQAVPFPIPIREISADT
jgi:hypothetical protein